eukprot:TRINITY_DN3414_c0_g1_i1.p1 TRINITY_DN3414_c0_g1~~TRINITY_DN3414_c0_g1_i1.p1  ORF type:complete len:271 (-),score=78.88 TRINITY_DN3414_c0_g1_i1:181-993(-)
MTGRRSLDPLLQTFSKEAREKRGRAVFVAFVTVGYPKLTDTVPIMLSLQRGGVDLIELGVPFSDPIADGPVIQESNFVALNNNVTYNDCLETVRKAREAGITVPIVFMGYYNPLLRFGEERAVIEAGKAGVNGFIVVDLPPEEGVHFHNLCNKHSMGLIPLVAPTTTSERLVNVCSKGNSFVYCVSLTGVTGGRTELPPNLKEYVERVRKATSAPLAVGFGISDREQFLQVNDIADGVVIGSALVKAIKASDNPADAAFVFATSITSKSS